MQNEERIDISNDEVYLRSYIPKAWLGADSRISLLLNEISGFGLYEHYSNPYIRGAINPANLREYVLEVSSPILMNHVSRAIGLAVDKGIIPPLEVNLNGFSLDSEKMYDRTVDIFRDEFSTFCNYIDCTDIVLFGRVESIIDYMSKRWLIEKGMDCQRVSNLFISKEMQRLFPASDRLDILRANLPEAAYKEMTQRFPRMKLSVQRASGLNFKFNDRTFAVIERPWGRDMAFAFTKIILEKANPREVLAVGGCGAVIEDCEIDSVIMPTGLHSSDFSIELPAANSGEVRKASCYNVDSPFDEDSRFMTGIKRPAVMEMECCGYAKALEHSNVPLKIALYIMDLPLKQLTLGKTYHNHDFLKQLFSQERRGKDCALEFLLSQL